MNNKPRRKIGRQFEAVEKQIHTCITDIRAAGEEKKTNGTWKTPQRKLSRKPRRKIGRQFEAEEEQIYKGTEDIVASGEEQKTNRRLRKPKEAEEEQYNECVTPRRKGISKPKRILKAKRPKISETKKKE